MKNYSKNFLFMGSFTPHNSMWEIPSHMTVEKWKENVGWAVPFKSVWAQALWGHCQCKGISNPWPASPLLGELVSHFCIPLITPRSTLPDNLPFALCCPQAQGNLNPNTFHRALQNHLSQRCPKSKAILGVTFLWSNTTVFNKNENID